MSWVCSYKNKKEPEDCQVAGRWQNSKWNRIKEGFKVPKTVILGVANTN